MPPVIASLDWSGSSVHRQPTLFGSDDERPPGFEYRAGFVTEEDARALVAEIERLEFSRVEMRGAVAKRRTAHFGWTYGYDARRSEPGVPIPAFLLPLRARVAEWAAIPPDDLAEALVTEYPPGAAIGWHRDAPMFGDVIAGVSLVSSCRMKFRPYVSPAHVRDVQGPRRTTHEIELAPSSSYLITGIARREFEHSIPPTAGLRYSITFRNLK
jgi:alkylated DNA repair protein (DNA oxidative demethylase)